MIVRLWNTVNQMAKTTTSGYQTQAEFNNDLSSVQLDLMTKLAPFNSVNQSVKDLLEPFAESDTSSATGGLLVYPEDYFRVLAISVSGYPAYPIATNEKDIVAHSPIRKPSTSNNLYYFYQEDGVIKMLPEETLPVKLSYLRYPSEATIVLTPVSDANNDYLVPTIGDELEWNENAFNFLLYMMLDRLGIETRENLTLEWSNIGIQKELANI